MNNRQFGDLGENMAAEYLEQQGCRILCRNYRCREGEIDILAEKDGILRVVEVKTRRSRAYGYPCEAVDRRKQEHIRKAALSYLKEAERRFKAVEMDVIEIIFSHMKNVF